MGFLALWISHEFKTPIEEVLEWPVSKYEVHVAFLEIRFPKVKGGSKGKRRR
jgi:hypothetical protein